MDLMSLSVTAVENTGGFELEYAPITAICKLVKLGFIFARYITQRRTVRKRLLEWYLGFKQLRKQFMTSLTEMPPSSSFKPMWSNYLKTSCDFQGCTLARLFLLITGFNLCAVLSTPIFSCI